MEHTTSPGADQPFPPAPGPGPTAPGNDGFFASIRRTGLARTQDRWVGGVAGGIARRFGIDPLLVRGILGVTVLLGGAGLVVYGLGWALLPEERDGRIHLQETIQGRFDAALLGAVAAVVIGLSRGDGWMGWWDERGFGWVNGLLWLAVVGAVVAMVVAGSNSRRRGGGVEATTTWSPAPATTGAGGPGTAAAWAAPNGPESAGPAARSSRAVPHPGYGAVPVSAPVGGYPIGGAPVPPPPSSAAATHAPGAPHSSGPAYPPPPSSAWGTAPGDSGTGAGSGGWSGGSGGWTPPPLPPLKPRVEGPGLGAVGAVVGLTLLTLAGLLVADRQDRLAVPVGITALGIGIVLAGLAIIVSGLRGRSSGTLGFLAIVGIVAAVPASVLTTQDDPFFFGDGERLDVASGSTWRPTTVAEASRGISVSFGDVDVDLTDVPLGEGTVEIPISLGAGDLTVTVPEDIAVTGDIGVTAGQAVWDVDGESRTAGFSGGASEQYASDEAAQGPVDLALEIRAGAGDVRVEEED
jgi:phage shock protein PspC (stress-responsive transcriptional regulator)